MDSNRFSRIVIVDSIPEDQLNTAKRLRDDLKIVVAAYPPTPTVEYVRIESANDLLGLLARLRDEVQTGHPLPMIHIECHGNDDGFEMADGSLIDWSDLKTPLTELNIATELNLFVSVAACTGAAIAKVISMGDRAPLWGLIGPTRPMYPDELEKAFGALFSTLLETKSAAKAIKAMEAKTIDGTYWRTTAEGLFQKGWKTYLNNHSTPEAMETRAKRMLEAIQKRRSAPYPSIADLKQRVKDQEPISHDRYVETFFMRDLFPSHRERFPLKGGEDGL